MLYLWLATIFGYTAPDIALSGASTTGGFFKIGGFGNSFANFNRGMFGYLAYIYLPLLLLPVYKFHDDTNYSFRKIQLTFAYLLLFIGMLMLQSLIFNNGQLGNYLQAILTPYIGLFGVAILTFVIMSLALLLITERTTAFILHYFGGTLQMALQSLSTFLKKVFDKAKTKYTDLNLDYIQRANKKIVNQEFSERATITKSQYVVDEPLIETPLDEYPRTRHNDIFTESNPQNLQAQSPNDKVSTNNGNIQTNPTAIKPQDIPQDSKPTFTIQVREGNMATHTNNTLPYQQYDDSDATPIAHTPRTQVRNNDEELLKRFQKANLYPKQNQQPQSFSTDEPMTFRLKTEYNQGNPLESFAKTQQPKTLPTMDDWWLTDTPLPRETKTKNLIKPKAQDSIQIHVKNVDNSTMNQESITTKTIIPEFLESTKTAQQEQATQDSTTIRIKHTTTTQQDTITMQDTIQQDTANNNTTLSQSEAYEQERAYIRHMPQHSNYKTLNMNFTQQENANYTDKQHPHDTIPEEIIQQVAHTSEYKEETNNNYFDTTQVYADIAETNPITIPIDTHEVPAIKQPTPPLQTKDNITIAPTESYNNDNIDEVIESIIPTITIPPLSDNEITNTNKEILQDSLVQLDEDMILQAIEKTQHNNISPTQPKENQDGVMPAMQDSDGIAQILQQDMQAFGITEITPQQDIHTNPIQTQDTPTTIVIPPQKDIKTTNEQLNNIPNMHATTPKQDSKQNYSLEHNSKDIDTQTFHTESAATIHSKPQSQETQNVDIATMQIDDSHVKIPLEIMQNPEHIEVVISERNIADSSIESERTQEAHTPHTSIAKEQATQFQIKHKQQDSTQSTPQQKPHATSTPTNYMQSYANQPNTNYFTNMPTQSTQPQPMNYTFGLPQIQTQKDLQSGEKIQNDYTYANIQSMQDSMQINTKEAAIQTEILHNTLNPEDMIIQQIAQKKEEALQESNMLIATHDTNLSNVIHNTEQTPFILPPLKLLQEPIEQDSVQDIELDSKIEKMLQIFNAHKIRGDIIDTLTGPVVTTFEFRPETHVKVSKILSHRNDLARILKAKSIRIQAPIPGKDVIGIQIPNSKVETIYLREILQSSAFLNSKDPLTIALGKDISGMPIIANLAKLPHLLVAGTTGSGKSVGVNAIILSLLYRNNPDNLKLMMIDPKQVEFAPYEDLPHLITPIINAPNKAIKALQVATIEMDKRYELFSQIKVKNIASYNDKVSIKMPNFVIIIDELADLMITGGKEAEAFIARIAQMGRAAGMHLIIATQRSSVNVITGHIKANLPSRISYRVGSRIDSKVILDETGAEDLLGNGDGLFTTTNGLIRIHAPWVSEQEVEHIVDFIKAQREPQYDESFLSETKPSASVTDKFGGEGSLLDKAKEIILQDNKTSISYLQRKLGIGYNKAASLIEALESEGFLSAPNSKGERNIL